MDIEALLCMVTSCLGDLLGCVFNSGCIDQMMCVNDCTSDDPELKQQCIIKCVASDPNQKFLDLSMCITGNECVVMGGGYECPLPQNREQIAPMTLEDLEGAWYVIRGLSRTFDCWECQKMTFNQVDDITSLYYYEYAPADGQQSRMFLNAQLLQYLLLLERAISSMDDSG